MMQNSGPQHPIFKAVTHAHLTLSGHTSANKPFTLLLVTKILAQENFTSC